MKILHNTLLAALMLTAIPALADVSASEPWIRGTVAKQTATGAFMTLKSTKATQLVSASSPVAAVTEVHEMAMEGNVMKMRPMSALDVPANTPVELKPGSYHIMLMSLKRPLEAGEKIPVTLTFQDAAKKKETLEVQAEVRVMTAPPMQHQHNH